MSHDSVHEKLRIRVQLLVDMMRIIGDDAGTRIFQLATVLFRREIVQPDLRIAERYWRLPQRSK